MNSLENDTLPLRQIYWRLKQELRSFLYQFPEVFILLARFTLNRHLLVGRNSEIVIEGFPRCANSFPWVAFEFAQKRPMAVATHMHAPGQVIWAVRHNIPVLLLIRDPLDCVPSSLIICPHSSINHQLKSYIRFYTRLASYLDKLVVAEFNQVISDFGEVIRRINKFYGKSFRIFHPTEQNVAICFRALEEMNKVYGGRRTAAVEETTVARPSKLKDEMKAILRQEIEKQEHQHLVSQAKDIYERYLCEIRPLTPQQKSPRSLD